MSMIYHIRKIEPASHRKFVAERLIALKAHLRAEITEKTDENCLRLASWNLMHFGDGGGYDRTTESMLYIAEIIDHFDLVAIQEVNENLDKFDELMDDYLGRDWGYIVTDTTEGARGNHERLAFAFRKSKVWFRNEAGEIVLPKGQKIAERGSDATGEQVQFARTPFCVAFQSGWLKFKICTVHIYYGKDSGDQLKQRRDEIDQIATFLRERMDGEIARIRKRSHGRPKPVVRDVNYLLLGDFNIMHPDHATMAALTGPGENGTRPFDEPESLVDVASALSKEKRYYDQIVGRFSNERARFGHGDALNMFDAVYRTEDLPRYFELGANDPESEYARLHGKMKEKDADPATAAEKKTAYIKRYYRKHQMSDHKLLWVELKTDYSQDYLGDIAPAGGE